MDADLLGNLRGKMKVKKGRNGRTIFQESDLSDHDENDEFPPPRRTQFRRNSSSNKSARASVTSDKSFTNGTRGTYNDPACQPHERNSFLFQLRQTYFVNCLLNYLLNCLLNYQNILCRLLMKAEN